MKKQIFFLAIILIAALFVSNQASAQSFTINPKNGWFENVKFDPNNFMDVYASAVQLNHRHFDDINKINIGDTVLFPARTIDGDIEYWVADAPSAHDDKHDCIWRLTERYLAYQLPTKPNKLELKPAPEKETSPQKAEIPWWSWLILGLFAIGFLYLFLRDQMKMHRNPDNHPPVIPGGLSANLKEAANQIAANNNVAPNNVLATERVVLVRDWGPQTLRVEMEFGDKIKRSVDIKSGEFFVLATLRTTGEKTQQELYRNHCGNKTGLVISSGLIDTPDRDENGKIMLPRGWRFIKGDEYHRPEEDTSEIINENSAAAAPITEQAKIETPTSDKSARKVSKKLLKAIIKLAPKNAKSIDFSDDGNELNVTIKFK